jgi:hypothetical protein
VFLINNLQFVENTLVIHFIYGSKPKREFKNVEEKISGGLLGGHIFIQCGEYFYGFESINRKKIHLFHQKKFNSIYTKEHISTWPKNHNHEKMMSIGLPVDPGTFNRMTATVEGYHSKTPYDYAVFGMRCASSTYRLLCDAGFFPAASNFRSMILIPYPAVLRKKVRRIAELNNYKIKTQPGSTRRIWEKGSEF